MTIIRVANANDTRLNAFCGLTNHQLRNRLDPGRSMLIAESQTAIRVALEEGVEPLAFLLDERRLQTMDDVLKSVPEDIPIYVLPPEEAEKLTGYRVTRGALCAMRRPAQPSIVDLLTQAKRVVVLEGMTDSSNVGATFRNAAALGADGVIVAHTCADPLCRRAVRVSMGNVFRVPWAFAPKPWPNELLSILKSEGFSCLALALRKDAISLADVRHELGHDARIAFFLGAEGPGLTKSVVDACDKSVIIPMSRNVDSLNVAAAGAVAMWELFK